ncbi:hypothetical protein [Mucilaginibacter arboris]|uniref:Uncharacterized protein n=1 Tax=Mucilaginibacter arboris TaxID=2682090 RepID=A0A7K1SS30_9SPHI|nr:hypothetical protein [Mucilaginibacter arboris]MVN20128.1 hypothetical protein [Mucilaginibacter arboris]
MTYTDKHIIESYSKLFEGLSPSSKIGLIESLTKSLKKENKSVETIFYNSFGAFDLGKEAEEIIEDIRSSRKFREKDIQF